MEMIASALSSSPSDQYSDCDDGSSGRSSVCGGGDEFDGYGVMEQPSQVVYEPVSGEDIEPGNGIGKVDPSLIKSMMQSVELDRTELETLESQSGGDTSRETGMIQRVALDRAELETLESQSGSDKSSETGMIQRVALDPTELETLESQSGSDKSSETGGVKRGDSDPSPTLIVDALREVVEKVPERLRKTRLLALDGSGVPVHTTHQLIATDGELSGPCAFRLANLNGVLDDMQNVATEQRDHLLGEIRTLVEKNSGEGVPVKQWHSAIHELLYWAFSGLLDGYKRIDESVFSKITGWIFKVVPTPFDIVDDHFFQFLCYLVGPVDNNATRLFKDHWERVRFGDLSTVEQKYVAQLEDNDALGDDVFVWKAKRGYENIVRAHVRGPIEIRLGLEDLFPVVENAILGVVVPSQIDWDEVTVFTNGIIDDSLERRRHLFMMNIDTSSYCVDCDCFLHQDASDLWHKLPVGEDVGVVGKEHVRSALAAVGAPLELMKMASSKVVCEGSD